MSLVCSVVDRAGRASSAMKQRDNSCFSVNVVAKTLDRMNVLEEIALQPLSKQNISIFAEAMDVVSETSRRL